MPTPSGCENTCCATTSASPGTGCCAAGSPSATPPWPAPPTWSWSPRPPGELAEIVEIALGNHVVRDRLTGTAVLDHEQAGLLDTLGYVARASGRAVDGRADHPFVDLPGFTPVVETGGDVLARLLVRAREAAASAALITDLTARLDDGSSDAAPSPEPAQASGTGGALAPGHGLGIVEAWRGLLVHRVEVGPDGRLTRVKVVDPSFVNWPALPVALTDVIVPDFPLANKSFNQSYAGNDL